MTETQGGDASVAQVPYATERRDLEAFTVTGFTAFVESGGALYEAVRSDGRWEILLTQVLGWAFDTRVGLHIDAFPESFVSEDDAMSFMMPVKRPKQS